jgi:hypothetical protein
VICRDFQFPVWARRSRGCPWVVGDYRGFGHFRRRVPERTRQGDPSALGTSVRHRLWRRPAGAVGTAPPPKLLAPAGLDGRYGSSLCRRRTGSKRRREPSPGFGTSQLARMRPVIDACDLSRATGSALLRRRVLAARGARRPPMLLRRGQRESTTMPTPPR